MPPLYPALEVACTHFEMVSSRSAKEHERGKWDDRGRDSDSDVRKEGDRGANKKMERDGVGETGGNRGVNLDRVCLLWPRFLVTRPRYRVPSEVSARPIQKFA